MSPQWGVGLAQGGDYRKSWKSGATLIHYPKINPTGVHRLPVITRTGRNFKKKGYCLSRYER